MYNPYIGIFKFILSVLVVAIHVEPFTGDLAFFVNNCIARIAVPSFFVYSSYFMFDKLQKNNWNKKILVQQEIHLAKYYGIWLLLHAPVVLYRLYPDSNGTLDYIWKIFQAVFLKGPYGALWFLPATMMALALVYFLGKKTNPIVCIIVSFPLFFFAALETEYFALIKDILWMEHLNNILVAIFGWLANGLTFGFFFCSIGFSIAYYKNKARNIKIDFILATISFVLLFVETKMIRDYNLGVSYGAMLMLIPTVYYIAQVLLNMKKTSNTKTIAFAKYLQTLSLLIYPMHFAIMEILEYLLQNNKTYMDSTTLQFLIVTAVTCGISALIIKLGNTEKCKFMRCFYGK